MSGDGGGRNPLVRDAAVGLLKVIGAVALYVGLAAAGSLWVATRDGPGWGLLVLAAALAGLYGIAWVVDKFA